MVFDGFDADNHMCELVVGCLDPNLVGETKGSVQVMEV